MIMILYIVRHAIAEPLRPGLTDKDRKLTEEGIRKMQKAAAGLRIVDAIPDVVLSSPLVRARQTAEILIEAFDRKPSLQIVPALAPPGDRTKLYSEIRKHEGAESVMLVGHEPSLGEIACEIISGTPGCYLTLKKGSACAIGITRMSPVPRGFLHWLMPPAILRKLS
jgi:phosphohistidine phosphatase